MSSEPAAGQTADLRELARIAGGDPRTFYRGISLDDLDLGGQNIDGMEFLSSPNTVASGLQLDLDLYLVDDERQPQHLALSIKAKRRQEERAAILWAGFLKDRMRGMLIIERYKKDKAALTNAVLDTLRTVWEQEAQGRRFSDLQIARKASGCFAKSEDKRAFVAFYFAKHLRLTFEIRQWLRERSVSKLSNEQRDEFYRLVGQPYLSISRYTGYRLGP